MHVPDGFLDVPTSLATGAAAAVVVGVSLRSARRELDDRTTPMTGLVAAFVFAAQMLNFPVGAGTSGHLLGGALAAILVGPWTAVLCMTVVLIVQALFFADGGLTALGTNIVLMGVVTVLVGWGVFALGRRLLPPRTGLAVPLAFVAALVSVPASALVFTGLYLVGGTADVSFQALFATMLGWHVLIGLGEAAITALTVAGVLSVRPDLVYGVRPMLADRLSTDASPAPTTKEATA